MADCEGDVSLCTHLPYISGTSLEEWVLPPTGLIDDDSSLVVVEQVQQLVCKLGSPQLDGQSGIESLEVTNGGLPQYTLGGKVAWYALPAVRAPQPDMQVSM